MKDVLRNLVLFIVVIVLVGLLGTYIGSVYTWAFPQEAGAGFFGFDLDTPAAILVVSYTFLLALIYTAWGAKYKYWWMGVLLLPALAFVLYFDLTRIWFYLLVGIVGWGIGYGTEKLLFRVQKSA